jgi:hypothetical protein
VTTIATVPGPFPRPLPGVPDLKPTVLVERWVCPKADGWHDYTSQLSPISPRRHLAHLRRQWWDIRGLLAIWYRLAGRCPHIIDATAPVRIAVRENEFTVQHQAVHLRHLIAACPVCPDPHHDEDDDAQGDPP